MTNPVAMAEIWRGGFLESQHHGHAVVCDARGEIVHGWGDPDAVVMPRSAAKMIQALPLIESGAADAHGLKSTHLALACASHNGAAIHVEPVRAWLAALGLDDDALRCGAQESRDREEREALIRAETPTCQVHNNCSGKHAGFLTLAQHLGAGPEYVDLDHPVQRACLDAWEGVCNETSSGYGIDGCSAPNHAVTMRAMARAMAFFASARPEGDPRKAAAVRLREAMMLHPELVAGENRACTRLMRAMGGRVAVKTGAEGYFTAILPDQKLGVAVKIVDGATRAAETAIAAILVKLGALEAQHPDAQRYINKPLRNWRRTQTGWQKAAQGLF